MPVAAELDRHFPRFDQFPTELPVWCLTAELGGCIHRFFDTSPLSPDGRRLAVFRLPFEDRLNQPGEAGQVVVIDLQTGGHRVVARTLGWEPQLGSNLNWADADHLVFNDVDPDTWRPMLVKLDLRDGSQQRWPGGVYQVSPDGRYAAAASMGKMRRTQPGYGVVLPDHAAGRNVGAPEDDGLFFTDLHTSERRLVVSLARAVTLIPELQGLSQDQLAAWEIYGFHCKWAPPGDRLIFTVRRYLHEGLDRFDAFDRRGTQNEVRFDVFTCRPDGSELVNALPAERWHHGGHHINFTPDGRGLTANIRLAADQPLTLIRVDVDGKNFGPLIEGIPGSGHPSLHPDGRHLLTDTYAHEDLSYRDGTVPLRWIDLQAATDRSVVRVASRVQPQNHAALRVDPHPAWDRGWRWVTFNGTDPGQTTRHVFLADFGGML